MLERYKKNKLDRFEMENVTSRIIIAALTLIVVWQQFILSSRVTGQRTVFMPPKVMSQEFWVAGDQVSSSYLEMMTQFIIFNLFNVTPENAKSNGDNLLALVEPDFHNAVDSVVKTQLSYLIENQISRSFYIGKIDSKKPGVLIVEGMMKEQVSDKTVSKETVVVTISYGINQGRFWLRGIDAAVKGGDKR